MGEGIIMPLTAEQKLEVLKELLKSLESWRQFQQAQGTRLESCFPETFLRALNGLFPNGV